MPRVENVHAQNNSHRGGCNFARPLSKQGYGTLQREPKAGLGRRRYTGNGVETPGLSSSACKTGVGTGKFRQPGVRERTGSHGWVREQQVSEARPGQHRTATVFESCVSLLAQDQTRSTHTPLPPKSLLLQLHS